MSLQMSGMVDAAQLLLLLVHELCGIKVLYTRTIIIEIHLVEHKSVLSWNWA